MTRSGWSRIHGSSGAAWWQARCGGVTAEVYGPYDPAPPYRHVWRAKISVRGKHSHLPHAGDCGYGRTLPSAKALAMRCACRRAAGR